MVYVIMFTFYNILIFPEIARKMNENNDKIRLVKFIAACGAASRRKAGELVKDGRICVNGVLCVDPSYGVMKSDKVALDGKLLVMEEVKYYVALNKPRNYTCSNNDVHADKLAVDLIQTPTPVRLYSAGRLDRDSEGLIIFSNDGDFVARLTHPSFQVRKRYVVETDIELNDNILSRFMAGIVDNGEKLHADKITRIAPGKYIFVLSEGKNREIRRMVKSANAGVKRLKRIQIGRYKLPAELAPGQFCLLNQDELELLLEN